MNIPKKDRRDWKAIAETVRRVYRDGMTWRELQRAYNSEPAVKVNNGALDIAPHIMKAARLVGIECKRSKRRRL